MTAPPYRKKLIEVALPLDAINKASAREKSIRHGHPSTLHLWWARRPLAACRAVLFSSLVNDPDDDPMYGGDEDIAATERAKLFDLIEDLVLWENSNNPAVINRARLEIARSIAANKVADGELEDETPLVANAPELPEETAKYLPDPPPEYTPHDVRFKILGLKSEQVNHFLAHYAPPVLDPFAGGGSIPLEAQRLGLRAYASDLNPVPVLINKALIEIPPKFAGMPPVNPEWQKKSKEEKAATVWTGARGLAEDVRYYGKWMRDEAEKRIGHLYPKVKVTQQMVDDGRSDLEPYVGQELTVIAWLWARTVKSPNPAVGGAHVPLIRSFVLSKKKGKEAHLIPNISGKEHDITFSVRTGLGKDTFNPEKGTVDRNGGRCLVSDVAIPFEHIRKEGQINQLGEQLLGIVALGNRCRVYLDVDEEQRSASLNAGSVDWLSSELPEKALGFRVQNYGLKTHAQLFNKRQLFTLDLLADLIIECRHKSELESDPDYAKAICTYLALALDRLAMTCNSLCRWNPVGEKVQHAFGRQSLSMIWDYPEANPFASATGSIDAAVELIAGPLSVAISGPVAVVRQMPAQNCSAVEPAVISTDPPYYDNVPYADLSDFFYVWLRRTLGKAYPTLFGTMLVPKDEELVADPYRRGGKEEARQFFESGMREVFSVVRSNAIAQYPTTIYYAFKQAEVVHDSVASTGWETMLEGLLTAGWEVHGTWPIRTEMPSRMRAMSSNALASSVILVCRPRSRHAPPITKREFANELRKTLPDAIADLQLGNIAPVDLAQAAIGPGIGIFSRHPQVIDVTGDRMSVKEALALVNQVLDEVLQDTDVEFDQETRWALKWFASHAHESGPYDSAETLARTVAISVDGLVTSGIIESGSGNVRLLSRDELRVDWQPATDQHSTLWAVTQYLIHTLESSGEEAAARLMQGIKGECADSVKELSYHLFSICERNKWADLAMSFNSLVVAWPEISKLSRELEAQENQAQLF